MIQQRCELTGAVPWIMDEHGRRTPGYDDGRRLSEVRAGLMRHDGVSAHTADASAEDVDRALHRLHEPDYLRALQRVRGRAPVLMAELAQPGLAPDTPVCAQVLATAREGIGTAISAARAIVAGARFSYALCRPPGHHAGPDWLGGYCYLNNAAAAAQTLRDGGFESVAILDLDLHYPNGTSALLERMTGTTLHSLHGSTGANLPWERVRPRSDREHLVAFREVPPTDAYLAALARCTHTLARSARGDRPVSRLRPRGGRPPRLAGPSEQRPSSGSAACSRRRAAGLRRAGGRLRAAVTRAVQPRLRQRPAARERGGGVSSSGREIVAADGLEEFRRRLDELDEEIARRLGERFAICREIALYKREHAIPMMQPDRVEQVRSRYLARGAEVQLPADFTAELFELLIAATCRMEDELIAGDGVPEPEPERALARDAGSTRERLGDSAQATRTGREP